MKTVNCNKDAINSQKMVSQNLAALSDGTSSDIAIIWLTDNRAWL